MRSLVTAPPTSEFPGVFQEHETVSKKEEEEEEEEEPIVPAWVL